MAQDQTILQTSRLTLRPARRNDLNDFHEFFSDQEVMRYWSTATHTNLEQTKQYLDTMIASPTNGHLDFVLALTSTGKVIGKAGIWSSQESEIGFMLHRSYWGQGYMAEAIEVLLQRSWKQGVEKVVADVDPKNAGSIGILKKFGFWETGFEERTGQVEGVWFDSLYLALERPSGGNVGTEPI